IFTSSSSSRPMILLPSPALQCYMCAVQAGSDSWEIVEGLRGGLGNVQEPEKQEGFMLKRRKWPMKGWHKVGVSDTLRSCMIEKGKLHGCIDVGLSVMAIKKKAKCIDLDAEENIYHLKFKSQELFDEWVSKLRHHRLYRQNEIAMFPPEKPLFSPHFSPTSPTSFPETHAARKRASLAKQSSLNFTSQAKVAAWLQSSDDIDRYSKELSVCEAQLLELNHLLRSMEVLHRTYSAPSINQLLQVPSCISAGSIRLHASNPNLSCVDLTNEKSYAEHLDLPIDVSKLQEDFYLHASMKSALSSLSTEKERLRQMLEQEPCPAPSTQLLGLKSALTSITIRNLYIIYLFITNCNLCFQNQDSTDGARPLVHQASNESRTSITESLSEFFDAQEVLLSASSSENEPSEDDSYISDISDNVSMDNFGNDAQNERLNSGESPQGQRRSFLPSPSPNTSNISLWNILRNNIGKDLSKVAMPVQLNEPVNTLQRLCEELEYSELLDRAAHTQDPFERMVYIATFAVSGYASSYYRAGGKPFNPVLGETYECDRPDKGFRFIAEQVLTNHPPISACHAESKNFIFWQDVRWKNKFWGKSMEIVPVGTTHVIIPGLGDHYEWNKVTSCIHNILSGQRWIEHYGEISIKNSSSDICQCKVTFVKAKYWNSSVNEVEGAVTDHKGKVIHKLFGKWHEGIYCGNPPAATCIWRTNPMPPDYEQYYGFTKFALELNELDLHTKQILPPTDTRFRLDQRLLEEGNVEAAEVQKQRIEQLQRDRRKVLEENNMAHQPRKSKDDTWVSNNTYWELRKNPGFSNLDCPVLW
uniref:Oxysterol-binding protein-related protein 3 n=1 Tax=Astyanax mexicanus TaxID=7994 RepID=W5JZ04_ASTMX